jgi:hypothetical protein
MRSDDSIDALLLDAWRRVRKTLADRPDEVIRRLTRGRRMWRDHPPRSQCLCVRANDTRLTPWSAACVPEHGPGAHLRHTVTLDRELLRTLWTPVRIHPLGEPWRDVAPRRGRNYQTLRPARSGGRFRGN